MLFWERAKKKKENTDRGLQFKSSGEKRNFFLDHSEKHDINTRIMLLSSPQHSNRFFCERVPDILYWQQQGLLLNCFCPVVFIDLKSMASRGHTKRTVMSLSNLRNKNLAKRGKSLSSMTPRLPQ